MGQSPIYTVSSKLTSLLPQEPIWSEIDATLDPKFFIGRSPEQVVRYCGKGGEVQQALAKYKKQIDGAQAAELTV